MKVKFLAEGLCDLDEQLKALGSKLVMKVGEVHDIVEDIIRDTAASENGGTVKGIWMTKDWASDELVDERLVRKAVQSKEIDVKTFERNVLIHMV